jgi:hypothetical protein
MSCVIVTRGAFHKNISNCSYACLNITTDARKVSGILVTLSFHELALRLVFRNSLLLFVFGRLFSFQALIRKVSMYFLVGTS